MTTTSFERRLRETYLRSVLPDGTFDLDSLGLLELLYWIETEALEDQYRRSGVKRSLPDEVPGISNVSEALAYYQQLCG